MRLSSTLLMQMTQSKKGLKLRVLAMLFLCISGTILGQTFASIDDLNGITNNRYYIEYYAKKKIDDSLYYYLNRNYTQIELLAYRDLCDLGFYYMKSVDSGKAMNSIIMAIGKGLDSITIERYYGNIDYFRNHLRKKVFEIYPQTYTKYKSSLDSSLINSYEEILNLDQTVRNLYKEISNQDLKKYLSSVIVEMDSINLKSLIHLIEENKGLGQRMVGHEYEKYLVLYLHCSDYSTDEYEFLEKYILSQLYSLNMSTYDFFKLFNRHLRDGYSKLNCKYFLVGNNKDGKCSCETLEKNWLENGLGSFEIYRRTINSIEINCD